MESEVLTDTFSIIVDKEQNICKVVGKGEVNFEKAMGAFSAAQEIPDMNPDLMVLADLRTVHYHPSFSEIMALKDKITLFKDNYKNKIALLSRGKIKILADMVCAFSIAASIDMKSFSEEDEAMSWLQSGA